MHDLSMCVRRRSPGTLVDQKLNKICCTRRSREKKILYPRHSTLITLGENASEIIKNKRRSKQPVETNRRVVSLQHYTITGKSWTNHDHAERTTRKLEHRVKSDMAVRSRIDVASLSRVSPLPMTHPDFSTARMPPSKSTRPIEHDHSPGRWQTARPFPAGRRSHP